MRCQSLNPKQKTCVNKFNTKSYASKVNLETVKIRTIKIFTYDGNNKEQVTTIINSVIIIIL